MAYQFTVPATETTPEQPVRVQIKQLLLADQKLHVVVNKIFLNTFEIWEMSFSITGPELVNMRNRLTGQTLEKEVQKAVWLWLMEYHQDTITFERDQKTGETMPTWVWVD